MTSEERQANHQTVLFHYDVHAFNFLYLNFYLVDVDDEAGAHVLIDGSHRKKRLRHILGSARIGDAKAIGDYGSDRIKVITGAAGEGFYEDASCYHKALAPITRPRLMLQLRYQ